MTDAAPPEVVAFDFDGTLTRRDTLLPFLACAIGGWRLALALLRAAPVLLGYSTGLVRNDVAKTALLRAALGGRPAAQVRLAADRFAATLDARLRPGSLALLREHRSAGRRLLLVSASLDWYLAPWARRQGFEACLASIPEVDAQGRVTGRLSGGNCHGEEKVRRLQAYLRDGSLLALAYGDTRGDLPMLRLARHAFYKGERWTQQR